MNEDDLNATETKQSKAITEMIQGVIQKHKNQENFPQKSIMDSLINYCELIYGLTYPINSIIIFGSVVKGTYRIASSDIDLILVFNELPESFSDRISFKQEIIGTKRPRRIQDTWFTREEFASNFEARTGFVLDALYAGWFLLDKDNYLQTYKDQLNELIRTEKILRKDDHWAWTMPDNKLQVIYL